MPKDPSNEKEMRGSTVCTSRRHVYCRSRGNRRCIVDIRTGAGLFFYLLLLGIFFFLFVPAMLWEKGTIRQMVLFHFLSIERIYISTISFHRENALEWERERKSKYHSLFYGPTSLTIEFAASTILVDIVISITLSDSHLFRSFSTAVTRPPASQLVFFSSPLLLLYMKGLL